MHPVSSFTLSHSPFIFAPFLSPFFPPLSFILALSVSFTPSNHLQGLIPPSVERQKGEVVPL